MNKTIFFLWILFVALGASIAGHTLVSPEDRTSAQLTAMHAASLRSRTVQSGHSRYASARIVQPTTIKETK